MNNPFLDDEAAPAANDSNPFLGLDDGIAVSPTKPAVLRAERYQPDQYVEAERRGKELGISPEVAARNPEQVKRIAHERYLQAVRQQNPGLADWLNRGENLTVSQDDVPQLSKLSEGIQQTRPYSPGMWGWGELATDLAGSAVGGFNTTFGSGIEGIGALYGAADRTVDRAIRAIPGVGNYLADLQRIETDKTPEAALRAAGSAINREAGYTPYRQSTATDVSGGLGQLVGQGLTFWATGGTGTLALNVGLGADQGSDLAASVGAEGTAGGDLAVLASAPVAAALEKVGLDALLKRAPPGLTNQVARWVTDKLVAAGIEGTQEAAEQVVYNAIAQQAYNPDQELTAGVADSFEVGGWVGGLARILVGGRYARTRAEQEGELLDLLGNDASASALRQRDPARFRELVDGLAKSGANTVYLDAEQALTYFQSASLDPASLGIDPEALSEAVALGGDVSIPMADWLTSVAPDHGQTLGKFARLTPLGVDRAGLDAFDEQVDAAAMRFLESVDESAGQQTDTAVYQDVLGQLLGNGMQPAVAEQNAQLMQSVFRSLANRSGQDAMALYQQYGLRIVRDQPEALSVLRKAPEVDAVIDSLLDRLGAGDIPTEVQAMGSSLVEWLSDTGGVTDPVMTGELRRLGESDRVNRRGQSRLVRPDAVRTLDEAREAAAEAGYLPIDSTVNDLLDALTQEVDGGPAIRVGGDVQAANTRAAILELDELLGRAGIDPADRAAAKAFLMGGQEFDQAPEGESVFYQDALPEPDLVASLRARIAELEAELRRDKLTGMRNRTAFDEDAALGWPNTAMLDLDGLKAVNDDLGHAWGDVLLKKAGDVMLAAEREGVRFYRQGGDEYTARFAEGVDAEAVMREVRDRLASVDVEMDTPDGPRIYSGIGAGYGIAGTIEEADARANADKERRVAAGQRAPRGQARAADRLVRVARGGDRRARSEPAGEQEASEDGLTELNQDETTREAIRRGYIKFAGDRKFTIGLTENADLSTFAHESAHFFLEVMGDLARDPNAPAGIAEDYAAIVRWLGVESRDQIGVDQHEQFARGFEKWLVEGNAPTPELTGAFRRFKSWMKAIYKTLTALNVELTDEVRGVFDRLVAGDEAVARAEQAVDMQPLFREAAAAGMSEARFREYLRLQALGHEEAEARMAARAVREVQREHEAWWKEESAAVQREVEAELYALPVYQAWANMAKGTQPDGSPLPAGVDQVKLDKGILRDRYGQEFLNKNLLRKNVYAVEGGVDPDLVAPTYGFANGDALVTALSNAGAHAGASRRHADGPGAAAQGHARGAQQQGAEGYRGGRAGAGGTDGHAEAGRPHGARLGARQGGRHPRARPDPQPVPARRKAPRQGGTGGRSQR
jgi:diguanylate cyclase (GGDEF)-like protein